MDQPDRDALARAWQLAWASAGSDGQESITAVVETAIWAPRWAARKAAQHSVRWAARLLAADARASWSHARLIDPAAREIALNLAINGWTGLVSELLDAAEALTDRTPRNSQAK